MKKKLLILAVAGFALASCSNDETVASQVNTGANEISFRTNVNGVTRAADITSASDLKSFKVYAFETSTTSTAYINNVEFVGPTTYSSTQKYYWPNYNLDFYAWSANSVAHGNRNTNVTPTDYHTFAVTADATAGNQADFIYAVKTNVANPNGAVTALSFAHQESKIILKVKNSADNLDFNITAWKIVYPDNVGTVTFASTTPTWSANTDQSVSNVFTSDFSTSSVDISAQTAEASQVGETQIMIPQDITKPTAYTGAAGTNIAGPYIAVQYTASISSTSYQAQVWGCWPIPTTTWAAGTQYTYTIDIADGGYFETNQDADTGLDPILANNVIKFASVTVSSWTDGGNTDVGM